MTRQEPHPDDKRLCNTLANDLGNTQGRHKIRKQIIITKIALDVDPPTILWLREKSRHVFWI